MPFIQRFGRPGLLGLAARTAVVAGTATAVSGGIAARQQQKAHAQYEREQYEAARQQASMQQIAQDTVAAQQTAPPSQQAAGAPGEVDVVSELQKLAALRESGALTESEFAAAKGRLLS